MLGVLGLPSGVVATELDGQGGAIDGSTLPMSGGKGRMASADYTLGLASRNVRSSFVRLPPATYGEGDNGFMAVAVRCARENGAAVYVGDGSNREPCVHRDDAARLFHLALESAPAGSVLHAVAEEGASIPFPHPAAIPFSLDGLNRWVYLSVDRHSARMKMTQINNANVFHGLHIRGQPVALYNAWDAGSAAAIAEAGAKAIATSSAAVASAQGYDDGENLPLDLALQIVGRIVETVDVPVTVDFEGGYSDDDRELASNISKLLDVGVVGINFEDRLVKGNGMYGIEQQMKRIAAIRKAAEKKGVPLFINARTDVFLGQTDDVAEAIERSRAYANAGASGFFIPGLTRDSDIRKIVEESPLPVNVMVMGGVSPVDKLAELGVARMSYGPLAN
jgi:2-methylisocitrate lyase-like PEP mutase family enzyme